MNAWSRQSVVGLPLSSRKDGHGIEGDGNENDKHLINDKNQKFPTMLSLPPSRLKL